MLPFHDSIHVANLLICIEEITDYLDSGYPVDVIASLSGCSESL